MDFGWTSEQTEIYEATVAFAESNLNAALDERDAGGEFDRSLWKALGEFGVLRSNIPQAYGGLERDPLTNILMLEALGRGCRDNGLALAVTGQIWTVQEPIARFGTDAQKDTYLPRLGSGEVIGSHAITEPAAGSDTYAMETTAIRTGDGYVLDGSKTLIGMAPVADLALVFAKTDPSKGKWGISAFLVELDWPGVTRSEPISKMGLRTNPTGELQFEQCLVPESARLGPEGAGLSISTDSLDWERSFILACQVGAMDRQLEEAITFAKTRSQFDQPVGKFQSVSNRISDMKLRLETARLLLYKAAWLKSAGEAAQLESALTKLHIAESFVANSLDAVRTHGGVGYLTEHGVERDFRDAVGGVIYGGTSDIQRQVIARLLGL